MCLEERDGTRRSLLVTSVWASSFGQPGNTSLLNRVRKVVCGLELAQTLRSRAHCPAVRSPLPEVNDSFSGLDVLEGSPWSVLFSDVMLVSEVPAAALSIVEA